jgi:effector-binding domain-containing protein
MFKISDFSKLGRVSVKALRYYDELGLLKPAQIDRFTGYRYYSTDQLPRLNRILALKDLGLSLDQIAQLLNLGLPPEEMRGMLRLKQAELAQQAGEVEATLVRIEARLRQIEQEGTMSNYDVVIKKIEPHLMAAVRDVVPTPPDQGRLWYELETYLQQHQAKPTGPCLTVYHDPEYRERDWDVQVCEPLGARVPETERVRVFELSGIETMACVIHHGPFVTISEAYQAAMRWIEANGYRICGPCREVYLQPSSGNSQTDPNTITEIQFPVEKAQAPGA